MTAVAAGNADTWLVVRAFQEAPVLADVLAEVRPAFRNVVVVDDGSTDGTAAVAAASGVAVVRHPVNLGPGAALVTGLRYALQDPVMRAAVCFDGDGQHLVGDAVRVAQRLRDGDVDVVYGSRFLGSAEDMGAVRAATLRVGRRFSRITTGVPLTDPHNGLRGFRRAFAQELDLVLPGMAYASELVSTIRRRGATVAEVPVTVRYTEHSRRKGQSSLNAITIAFDVTMHQLVSGSRP